MTAPFESLVLLQFQEPMRDIVMDVYDGVFDVLLELYGSIVGRWLTVDPAGLDALTSLYQISTVAFMGLMGIFGLTSLGLFQLFPDDEKMDPQRFFRRAFAATLSLFIVNPPGSAGLFSRGAYAWAMAVTNALSNYLLSQLGTNIGLNPTQLGSAISGTFVTLGVAVTMGAAVILVQILLLLALILRQFAIYFTFGIYPLLIALWVADFGPLKYGKELSMKFLKATAVLLVGGVLVSGVITVGTGLITSTNPLFAGGTAAPPPSGTVAEGTFSTYSGGVIFNSMFKLYVLFAVCALPVMLIYQMLGPVGSAATKTASAGAQAGFTVVSGTVAVATGGTSSVVSGAVYGGAKAVQSAGTQVAKKGVTTAAKQMGKKALKKGGKTVSKQTGKQALSKGRSVAQSAGKKLAEKAPDSASEATKKGASKGLDNTRAISQEAAATPAETAEADQDPSEQPVADQQATQQARSQRQSRLSSTPTSEVADTKTSSETRSLSSMSGLDSRGKNVPSNPGMNDGGDTQKN